MKRDSKKNGNKKSTKKHTSKKSKTYSIKIIKERCKGCELCVIYCPTGTLAMSDKINLNGNFIPEVKNKSKCKGCNLCFKFCPDFAIVCNEEK